LFDITNPASVEGSGVFIEDSSTFQGLSVHEPFKKKDGVPFSMLCNIESIDLFAAGDGSEVKMTPLIPSFGNKVQ